ncbi:MAG: alpha/beta hydrolase, partial [Vicinamibacterales bacterium]
MTIDTLTHVATGDGPPLILLNGALMTYVAWDPLAVILAKSSRVVRCDFRGQLLSPGDAPPTIEGHAADVLRLMDALQIESAHVAGVSFGALAGLALAAAAPARVRSLAAISGTDRVSPETQSHCRQLADACRAALAGGDGGRVFDLVTPVTWSPAFLAAQSEMLAARRQQVAALPRAWFSG